MFDKLGICQTQGTGMTKASASKSVPGGAKLAANGLPRVTASQGKVIQPRTATGAFVISRARFEAVMRAAEQSGLLSEKSGRIGGRVSQALVEQAKRQTGIETDTDLIEFALASVALEDNFADVFQKSRGKIDPKLKLGF